VPKDPQTFEPTEATPLIKVRVSGPQVGENKRDQGDRPCMYVFHDGEEVVAHEVEFHGQTWLRQDFVEGCPVTGAVLWLETASPVTVYWREDLRMSPHLVALNKHTLDDVERRE
jgi:hypothetical protein